MHPDRMSLSRRRFGALAAAGLAATALPAVLPGIAATAAAAAAGTYQPTPESLDQHPPAPEWFQDAKFGVYWHFGAFTTPEFGTEWYPRNMYNPGTSEKQHHIDTYGDPTVWGYDRFINGSVDKAGNPVKFSPKLKSAGGQFDPAEWARIVKNSGARFAGPVAEHHDGFSMWDSQVNEWNSVGKGPQLNLLQLFTDAVRAQGLRVLVAMHTAYHYNGFYEFAPRQTDTSLQKLFGQLPRATEDQLWLDKNKEVIDRAKPDILWQDFMLNSVDTTKRHECDAYYYNQAQTWGREVVVTHKIGDVTEKGEVEDYERGGPADIVTPYWLTDDAISSSSWSYVQGIGYYSGKQMLHSLIDRVSKNGNMLLNISPTKEGVIPQGQIDVLNTLGTYLGRNGESIYATRAWTVYGEGPNKAGGGSFTAPLSGGPTDIRYTRDKANKVLYATVLGWPGNNGVLTLATLAGNRVNLSKLTSVQLLGATPGSYTTLGYTQDSTGLRVTMPGSAPVTSDAYVVKLTFSDAVPTPGTGTAATAVQVFGDVNYAGPSAALAIGRYTAVALSTLGIAQRSISSVRSADGHQLVGFGSDSFTGTSWTFTGTNPDLRTTGNNDAIVSAVVRPDPGRWFRIISQVNQLALDGGGAAGASPSLKQWTPDGSTNLQFQLVETDSGYYRLTNRTNGLAADGQGATSDGAPVGQQSYTGATSQQWLLRAAGGGTLVFVNRATGRVLDSGGSVASGSPAKQWTDGNSPNFLWTLVPV